MQAVEGILGSFPKLQETGKNNTIKTNDAVFENALSAAKELLQTANAAEKVSTQLTYDFMTGNNDNIHNLMIAQEKSSILLQFTMQVRNKVLDAYNEIIKLSV